MKTYTLLADGFEEIEAFTPLDIMLRAGIDAKTVSVSNNLSVIGAHGIAVKADMLLGDINKAGADMIILPGGGGYTLLDENEGVRELIGYAADNGIYIAAICAAPSILGKMRLLEGKKATCYPGYEKYCFGAKMTGEKTVVDGKIITGRGPGVASNFGFEIVRILLNAETAARLFVEMQYND